MRWIGLLSFLLATGCTGSRTGYTPGQFSDPHATELVGSALPPFSLPSPSGDGTVTSESLAGHPALVVFWATWCPACLAEIPRLKAYHERLGPKGLRILSLSVDDSPAPVPLMVDRAGITWPVAVNASPWFGAQRLESLPQVFLVDRSGKVVDSFTGEVDSTVFRTAVERLVAGG